MGQMMVGSLSRRGLLGLCGALLVAMISTGVIAAATPPPAVSFDLVRSGAATAAGCLVGATGTVQVTPRGNVETMDISVSHLPPNTDFDVFVIQLANAPFGLSWYQGDLKTNSLGVGTQRFVGRFSIETFIVAPGSAPAPVVHTAGPFPDAKTNPATAPVHTFHLGLWFNSPADAAKAGCPNTVTAFNGDHNAGIQAMSTRQFLRCARCAPSKGFSFLTASRRSERCGRIGKDPIRPRCLRVGTERIERTADVRRGAPIRWTARDGWPR